MQKNQTKKSNCPLSITTKKADTAKAAAAARAAADTFLGKAGASEKFCKIFRCPFLFSK
ncbi:hypothetical protein NEILACOT_04219 [Neisseria lactamica ATCC 23970]|uniref:Uncharacterized protein n=1 Tax=Neisseria lactamica ATCC 23970 TaxID=546265 RepID=D0W9K7_NEILA|nr:hypothetical protein NEILACOT_04219 [Neisseria lactamica ATCC 23970]